MLPDKTEVKDPNNKNLILNYFNLLLTSEHAGVNRYHWWNMHNDVRSYVKIVWRVKYIKKVHQKSNPNV